MTGPAEQTFDAELPDLGYPMVFNRIMRNDGFEELPVGKHTFDL